MNYYHICFKGQVVTISAYDVDSALSHYGIISSDCSWIDCDGVTIYKAK